MGRRHSLFCDLAAPVAVLSLAASSVTLAAQASTGAAPPIASPADASAVVKQYCVGCHTHRRRKADLSLDDIDFADAGAEAERLEKVVRKLRARSMPPEGARRPDESTYNAFAAWLEGSLDRAAAAHVDPGRTEAMHRLNRTEYA